MDALYERILALREEPEVVKEALEQLRDELGIQINTLKNYTRWPLAIMRDLRWTEKDREGYRRSHKTFEIHRLTPLGKERAQKPRAFGRSAGRSGRRATVRPEARLVPSRAFCDDGTSGLLISLQWQVSYANWRASCGRHCMRWGWFRTGRSCFSPFQSLSIADSSAIFPSAAAAPAGRSDEAALNGTDVGRGSRDHLFVAPIFVASDAESDASGLDELKAQLRAFREAYPTLNAAAHAFAKSRQADTQTQFYPLVTHLLQLLGFKSDYSRAGVNYQRWDACVWLHDLAVPIEIKSPTEEQFLSTKAVRQAIENKVILLARGRIGHGARSDQSHCGLPDSE